MDDSLIVEGPSIVFIGGTGRSGTNISKATLSNHPQVATLPFEYRFIIDPDGIIDFYRSYSASWSPYLADRRLKRLEQLLNTLAEEPLLHRIIGNFLRTINPNGKFFSPRSYHGWNLNAHLPNFKHHTRELLAELREFSYPAAWVGTESYVYHPQIYHSGSKPQHDLVQVLGHFIQWVISDFLSKHHKKFYVEDNTWNILFAHELIQLVPQAKILHIYRDPRDVVASFVQQRWCPSDIQQAAILYKSIITHWFNIRADLPDESYYEVRLENLVNSTEDVVKNICEFTGIPYDPILLTTDLSSSHTGRWKHDFTHQDQEIVQEILDDVVTVLGYE